MTGLADVDGFKILHSSLRVARFPTSDIVSHCVYSVTLFHCLVAAAAEMEAVFLLAVLIATL